jgi:hypothetical protein
MIRQAQRLLILVVAILLVAVAWPTSASAQSSHPRRGLTLSSQAGLPWKTPSSSGTAVELTPNPAWPSLPGATWIWRTPSETNEIVTFTQKFNIRHSGGHVLAVLNITADNAYQVSLNGKLVGANGPFSFDGPDEETWATIFEHHLTPRRGRNVLEIRALNYFGPADSLNNPAGILYRLDIRYGCSKAK